MNISILNILAGAVLGLASKAAGDFLIAQIMRRRKRELVQSRNVQILTGAVMAAAGAGITVLCIYPAEICYLFLLLILAEAITLIDIYHRLIPNSLVLTILLLTVLFGVPDLLGAGGFPDFHPLSSLIGFAGCFVIFMAPAVLSKQIGAGDVKLAAAMGFCLGWMNALYAIVLMGIFMVGYLVLQRSAPFLTMVKSMIPMGPFLASAMIVVQLLARAQEAHLL